MGSKKTKSIEKKLMRLERHRFTLSRSHMKTLRLSYYINAFLTPASPSRPLLGSLVIKFGLGFGIFPLCSANIHTFDLFMFQYLGIAGKSSSCCLSLIALDKVVASHLLGWVGTFKLNQLHEMELAGKIKVN